MTKRILLERQIQGMLNWKTLDKTIEMITDTDIKAHLAKCHLVIVFSSPFVCCKLVLGILM